jgi:uncharacterized protein (DUF2062 family)
VNIRRLFWELRTEGAGPVREAFAIAAGVFIGCLPVYGLHLVIVWLVGWVAGLNRLKMYVAANISNPFVAPFLLLSEVQIGAWVRRGHVHALSVETVKQIDPWSFGADLIVGSLALGAALGVGLGAATYSLARSGADDEWFASLVRQASDRFVDTSITAWEFARGKLRGDPVYRAVLEDRAVPSGGTLVDVGCGQGLVLALLIEAADVVHAGGWPSHRSAPPVFDALVGIELRPRIAAIARRALGGRATIVEADARTHLPPSSRVMLFFDVLHMIPTADQETLLAAAARALDPAGVILVREADAASGWGFQAVRFGNRLKALATGNWGQTFHFRTHAEWIACFERLGFHVRGQGTSAGTPFANELFVLRSTADDVPRSRPTA